MSLSWIVWFLMSPLVIRPWATAVPVTENPTATAATIIAFDGRRMGPLPRFVGESNVRPGG